MLLGPVRARDLAVRDVADERVHERVLRVALHRRAPLGPGGGDDEDGDARGPVDQVVDEVEQALVGPVEVLDDDYERVELGEALEEPAPGGEALRTPVGACLLAVRKPDERLELPQDPRGLVMVGNRLLDDGAQLLRGPLLRLALEDPGVRLEDLAERPERHAVAVGKAAALAPVDELRPRVDLREELVDEPALADARHADERDELRRALVLRTGKRADQQAELSLAADERRLRRVRDVGAVTGPRLDDLPDRNRLRLALRLDRRRLPVLDHARSRVVGRLADQDPVHRRGGLEPRGGVDDIP